MEQHALSLRGERPAGLPQRLRVNPATAPTLFAISSLTNSVALWISCSRPRAYAVTSRSLFEARMQNWRSQRDTQRSSMRQIANKNNVRLVLTFVGDHRLQGCEELRTGKGLPEKARNFRCQSGQRLVARDHNDSHVLAIQAIDQVHGKFAVSQINVDERYIRSALRQ